MPDRPSGTAVTIALSLLALRARRDGLSLVSEQDARLLRGGLDEIGGLARFLATFAGRRWAIPLVHLIEWCVVPGIIRHFGVRKRLIEETAERIIAGGVRGVVVLAAGLDLLALRLAARRPALALIEIDRPGSVRIKQRMLDAAHVRGVHLIPADLGVADLCAFLAADAPAAPTLFVAEGLTMYLSEEQVGDLFERIARVPGAARLVFTFLEPGPDGRAVFPRQGWVLARFLRASRERFRWGSPREHVGAFVDKHGWALQRILGPEQFGPGFTGEFIAVCERSESTLDR